jgi:hypothetical protein
MYEEEEGDETNRVGLRANKSLGQRILIDL